MNAIRTILVGVDGSPNSRRAVEWTAELASALGAKVYAVHAIGLLEHDPNGEVVPSEQRRDETTDTLRADWCAPLTERRVDHECLMRDGSAVSVVLDAAADLDIDLIVLGSRGLGGFPELLLGSTSTQVAQRSTVPVVIVPVGTATVGDVRP